jgi:hypothetical protein
MTVKKVSKNKPPAAPLPAANPAELAAERIEADATQGARTSVERRTRAYSALLAAANGPAEDDLFDAVCDRREEAYRLLSQDPATTAADLARKLAVLVTEMLRTSSGEPQPQDLALAASALADAVLLPEGAAPVHPGVVQMDA